MKCIPWLLLLLVASLLGCEQHAQQQPAAQQRPADEDILFAQKAFYDGRKSGISPEIVYVAGALSGAHVGYRNNYTAITCYQDRMECVVSVVEQIGSNQIGRVDMPDIYPVTTWNKDIVVAGGYYDINNCRRVTITIVRTTELALWVSEPDNQTQPKCKIAGKDVLKWTVEDPPSRKAFEARVENASKGKADRHD